VDVLLDDGERVAMMLFFDVLPYAVGRPATYGFAGFDGRTPADNAPEAKLSLVSGTAVPSGLKPSVAAAFRAPGCPYVVSARALVESRVRHNSRTRGSSGLTRSGRMNLRRATQRKESPTDER
jgi:hypothetical protein